MKPRAEANKFISIWSQYGPNTKIIDLNMLISELINKSSNNDNLEVQYKNANKFDGALVGGDSGRWCAVINKNIRLCGRKRFTLAHEIGHFVLHRNLQKEFYDGAKQLHDFNKEQLEFEANLFASQLLMPPDVVRRYSEGCFSVDQLIALTEELSVSKQAAGLSWAKIASGKVGFVVSRDGFILWGWPSDSARRRRVFFPSDSELPAASITCRAHEGGTTYCAQHEPGVWHDSLACKEEVYMASDGFAYTCLEFYD